jgi:hypothetical protein
LLLFSRNGYLTVDPNIDLDPKIVPYFDPIISVFDLLIIDFISK